jgi:hypothetical protein
MGSTFDTAGAIAAEQHGRVTRAQLLAAGVTPARIARWLADGRLRRVHTGVYAVGHVARSLRADYMAAVIACQPPAAGLSGWAAGHLLRIHVRPRPPRPEVTVATTAGRRRPGIIVHRARELHPLDLWIVDRIPVTSPERTLLDLAPQLSGPALVRACHEAWVHYKTTPDHVAACMRRNPHRPGAAKLWLALGGDVTLSKLEDGFLAPAAAPRRADTAHEHRPRWRQGRLPLGADRPNGRAAELPLPRLAPCVRGGRRTAPALEPRRVHVGRRLRARPADGRRARAGRRLERRVSKDVRIAIKIRHAT